MQEFFIASQGGGQLRCGLWTPEGAPRAVVQLIHGIAEHIGRYDDFANFLTAHGFAVAADDHMGHGGSVTDGLYGYFRGGWLAAVADEKALHDKLAADYPGIAAEAWYIDIMTANLVNPAVRSGFQVFLLPNLYGDIITDEAAQLQGGVGTAGSANIGDRYAMFEAVHGSAPRMIEAGLGAYADPSSLLRASEMMLRHIALPDEADRLARAMERATTGPDAVRITGDATGATTQALTDRILQELEAEG